MNLNSILNILNHMKSYDYNNSLKKNMKYAHYGEILKNI